MYSIYRPQGFLKEKKRGTAVSYRTIRPVIWAMVNVLGAMRVKGAVSRAPAAG